MRLSTDANDRSQARKPVLGLVSNIPPQLSKIFHGRALAVGALGKQHRAWPEITAALQPTDNPLNRKP